MSDPCDDPMIDHVDHVVLTERSIAFYIRVLGMTTQTFAGIGSGDVCLITNWTIDRVVARLESEGIEIAEGPVGKTGATGPIVSVYFNDPDGNLIEIGSYV